MPKKIEIKNRNTVLAWHFLPERMQLAYNDDRTVSVGKWVSVRVSAHHSYQLRICHHGLHASRRIVDALKFARLLSDSKGQRIMVCRVRVGGDRKERSDKLCGQYRKILWCFDIRKVLKKYLIKRGIPKWVFKSEGILNASKRIRAHYYEGEKVYKHDNALLQKMIHEEARRLGLIEKGKKNGKAGKSSLSKKRRKRRR